MTTNLKKPSSPAFANLRSKPSSNTKAKKATSNTGYREIQRPDAFQNSLRWNLGKFDFAFGGTENNIGLTDIDGIVERNGHILVLELKEGNATVKTGQKILFDMLVNIYGFTVIVAWTSGEDVIALQRWGEESKKISANTSMLENILADWWAHANDKSFSKVTNRHNG